MKGTAAGSWTKPLACQGFYSGLHWNSVGVPPRPLKFSEDFSCAPIDLIKSFFTLHWLRLHGSNSRYVSPLSDSTRRQRRCTAARPSQQKSASLLSQRAANGFHADVYKAHSDCHSSFFFLHTLEARYVLVIWMDHSLTHPGILGWQHDLRSSRWANCWSWVCLCLLN